MSSPPPPFGHPITAMILLLPLSATTFILTLLFLLILLLRRRRPSLSTVSATFPRRFSYAALRRATSNFSTSRRLGHGGSGVVFSGMLTLNPKTKLPVAVKLMDSSSLQSELEFHNEIMISKHLVDSERFVKQLGFATSRRKGRHHLCLVYELMANGNLQDCLLHKKCVELMEWTTRFRIVLQIAQGLAYLHHHCDPPVIHGDVKPSNILLDENFCAKIGDFGLARLNLVGDNYATHLVVNVNDGGSVVKSESVGNMVMFEEGNRSPEMVTAPGSPLEFFDVESDIEGQFDIGHEVVKEGNVEDLNDDIEQGLNSVIKVKDHVIEWIGTDVDKQKPLSSWLGASSRDGVVCKGEETNKGKKGLKWWVSKIDGRIMKKKKRREAREWWKEQYCEELSMKKITTKKKKKRQWWIRDDRKNKIRGESWSNNVNWSFDWHSGDLNKTTQAQVQTRVESYDLISGEILKSGGISSSTPSTRGTVCYIAPEYSTGISDLSEKCDVYSFGVLVLVVIAGRRPLQVTDSPMSEFHRANLLLWARQLARTGKFLDLVDENVRCLDKEQARLCILVALLCLHKSPDRRPSMKEVVGMLNGELDPPQLPKEWSTYPFKSKKKLW